MAHVFLEVVYGYDGNVIGLHGVKGIHRILPDDRKNRFNHWVQVGAGRPVQTFHEKEIVMAEVVDE